MEVKIILPESIQDITLDQYQRFYELAQKELPDNDFLIGKVSIFTGWDDNSVNKMQRDDFEFCLNQIDKALNEEADFKNRFFIRDVEFGFITLGKMTQAEYVDACKWSKNIENPKDLHRLIAVLFRPITDKGIGNTYKVADYEGTEEYNMIMKHTPMSVVNGCLSFFLNLHNDLLNYTLKYTREELVKVTAPSAILGNGIGSQA